MSVNSLPPAIFLMGPTASGKTALAIELAQQLPCDLISVDSALVYRSLDIGSAKPSAQEQALAPHRLIDIRDPQDAYSAAEFRQDALAAMAEITAKGRIPLLVGGTMMYFKALYEGIADMPTTDLAIRADIEAEAAIIGWPAVHQQLSVVDPESASRIHPNHSQRIERALNVFRSSGQTMTECYRQQSESVFPYQVVPLAIAPLDRRVLHERIEKRFRLMVEQGLIDEVRSLHSNKQLHLDLPSMRAVGYRQVWDYLDGRLSYDEMIERGIIATRQLAKRQFTWLRSWPDILYLYTDADNCLTAVPESVYVSGDEARQLEGQAPVKLALKYLSKISHSF